MSTPNIKPFTQIVPMVYCYTTPGVTYHEGWSKIGYTAKQTVQERVAQQTHTADITYDIKWFDNAIYKDGSGQYFTDKDFHGYLTKNKQIEQEPGKNNEWFKVEPTDALTYFNEFATRSYLVKQPKGKKGIEEADYILRAEQEEAVSVTKAYFENGGTEFLWNAKPRFGKTLTSYDLVRQMGREQDIPLKVLVVTNRPSIANSWAEDFVKFVGWRGEYCFVSENDAVKDIPSVITRNDYLTLLRTLPRNKRPGMIAFESLQGLKGSVYFGGAYDKLKWMSEIEFDLLIVDESQEGVDTQKTDRAFKNIARKHTLYLSGTPFKALANARFNEDQIFNWSYTDEQKAKQNWSEDATNVYETLPRLEMYTYQMSSMIEGELSKGAAIFDDGRNVDYTFDLNEFFATNESGVFKYKEDVEKFLDALTTQAKYPFSTPELRAELPHTLWLLNRVDSAKALAKLLKAHPVFSEYEVVLAAGDGRLSEDEQAEKSYDKVKKAIASNEKTITLSVGQLTVGVTIPEWAGVLMLSNMKSPSSYMQAAFRVQNPYETTVMADGTLKRMRKERAYVFDFDPARTLVIFDEFANNLSVNTAGGSGTARDRKANISELLNFFPVLGEDDAGRMVEIDAQAVLSIPRKLKSVEVVRHGFMSNYLFQNISNVFSAPSAVTEIVSKLAPAKNDSFDAAAMQHASEIQQDNAGNVVIPNEVVIGKSAELFGQKVYETVAENVEPALDSFLNNTSDDEEINAIKQSVKAVGEALKESVEKDIIDTAFKSYDLKKGKKKQVVREANTQIDYYLTQFGDDFQQQSRIAKAEFETKQKTAQDSAELEAAAKDYRQALNDARSAFTQSVNEYVEETIQNKPKEVTEKFETFKAQEEKASVEETVRDHLRGFSRTIPSFIMAYGDENLTLANFDDYTEDDVFEEVTGITEEEFRFLRDGGDYIDEVTGKTEHFDGALFDETVFNDSIREFLSKRSELSNYFDEGHTEDIFDYIPPQKTNQIFTPRWVVKKMVEALEEENPGCYDDPNSTFADLYMKSGMYITEIVKRLFNSPVLKYTYPDEGERIAHIMQHQVYGMAPTRIIYLIATNYILGFDESLKVETKNFVQADAAKAAKEGTLQQLVDQHFGA